MVFVNAGTQLAHIASPRDVLSPELIVSFMLLGFFPYIGKRILSIIKKNDV